VEIADLDGVLGAHDAFRLLPPSELSALAARFTLAVFRLGDVVVDAAHPDRALGLVYAGRARLVEEHPGAAPVTVAVLGKGDTFGEHVLLGTPGSYAVRAASDLIVLRLDERHFLRLTAAYPDFRDAFVRRVRDGAELAFLSRLSLFSSLKLPQLTRLRAELARVDLAANEQLYAEGTDGDTGYIVREGRLRFTRSVDGVERQVGLGRPGEFVGEMGLLCGLPRVVTATAIMPTVVLALSRRTFDEIVSDRDKRTAMIEVTNRLLQIQSIAADDSAGALAPRASFDVQWIKAGGGWFPRAWPVVRADEIALSGLACLAMVEAAHRKSGVAQSDVDRRLADARPDTMETLVRAAEEHGYLTRPLKLAAAQLRDLPLPAIVEREPGQFSVLFAIHGRRVVIANPRDGLGTLERGEFEAGWDGRALCLTHLPTADVTNTRADAVFRQFLPFVRPHRAALAAIVALSLVTQLTAVATPLFNQVIIDRVLVTLDHGLLGLLLIGILTVTLFQLAAGAVREYLTAQVMRRTSSAVQLRFFDHILSLPVRTIAGWRVGDLIVRLHENDKLLRLVSTSAFQAILGSAAIGLNAVLLFTLSPTLAPVALVFIAAYGALMVVSSPRLRDASRRAFEARSQSESHVIESIGGIQTIKALALEQQAYDRGYRFFDLLKRREFESAQLAFTIGQIAWILNQFSVVVVLGWGASLALDGEITTGQLIAFNALLGATLSPLTALVNVWDDLKEVRISFERTADVLRLDRERSPKHAAGFAIRGDVTLENVTFRYGEHDMPALRDVSISVRAGQKIALVGRSGSGKTTLAGLLLNLYAPTAGRILLDQVDITTMHKPTLRRQIGYVEQQPQLFSGTIRENIARADPAAGLETVVAAATLAGAHEFVQQLPLAYDTQIGERGMTLSGGQQQRLVIARALVANPRMLVLDEATAALDTESEQIIQRNLDTIMSGKTSFVIAHRLSTVRNADRIIVLDEGRVVEEGTHAQLMAAQGLYHHLATGTS
jgi:ATP-binding cassette subfamily B protein